MTGCPRVWTATTTLLSAHQRVGGSFQARVTLCRTPVRCACRAGAFLRVVHPNPTAGPERRGAAGAASATSLGGSPSTPTSTSSRARSATSPRLRRSSTCCRRLSALARQWLSTPGTGCPQPLWRSKTDLLGDEVQMGAGLPAHPAVRETSTSTAHNFCGARLDNVYNADRLLRVPGTHQSQPDHPVPTRALPTPAGRSRWMPSRSSSAAYGATALESDQPVVAACHFSLTYFRSSG